MLTGLPFNGIVINYIFIQKVEDIEVDKKINAVIVTIGRLKGLDYNNEKHFAEVEKPAYIVVLESASIGS